LKKYGDYRPSALNDREESIKNHEYLMEFEVKFKEHSDTEQGAWEEPIRKKIRGKKSLGLSI
jgi:hypothetical protein